MKTLIAGLGNSILRDDGAGIIAAREVYRRLSRMFTGIDLAELSCGGWRLLDHISGYERVVIIDVMCDTGLAPGSCFRVEGSDEMPRYVGSSHGMGLFEALEFARNTGTCEVRDVSVYAIAAEDVSDFGEEVSEDIVSRMDEIAGFIINMEFGAANRGL